MFRRREDSLFDNTTDPNQPEMETEEAVAAAPSSSASASFSSPSFNSSAPSRPAPERSPLPPQAQPASSFRPTPTPMSTPMNNDLSRNRMPEAKPSSAFSSPSSSPAPSSSAFSSASPLERSNKSGKRVLTVGNDILLKGEIATCDRLVIEGKVDATLNDVHTVEIAEGGSFKGAAQIEDAEISGIFEGDLIVRNRLVIYATGKVRGKITYGEIEIERGGELTGEIKTTTTQGTISTRRKQDDKVAA